MRIAVLLAFQLLLVGSAAAGPPAAKLTPWEDLAPKTSESSAKMFAFKVLVSADGDLAVQIKHQLDRKLGELKNVEITDQNPEFLVSIVAVRLALKDGTETGYALSTVVRLLDFGKSIDEGLETGHYLRVVPNDGLAAACAGIAATVDQELLEALREAAAK